MADTEIVFANVDAYIKFASQVIFLQASTTVLRHFLLHAHSLHVSLDTILPRFSRRTSDHRTPVPFILVHFVIKSFSTFCSKCSNHLNLALWILSSTHLMPSPRWLNSSSLGFLSFKGNPNILWTIILSALPNLSRPFAFIARVSLSYTNTLNTGIIYFPLQFQNRHPFFLKTGASSSSSSPFIFKTSISSTLS